MPNRCETLLPASLENKDGVSQAEQAASMYHQRRVPIEIRGKRNYCENCGDDEVQGPECRWNWLK